MNHVVMADPENISARALLADTYEQLGYQAESGPWRNFYLYGAFELRHGLPEEEPRKLRINLIQGMPLENIFQALAVRLNGSKAEGKRYTFNLNFSDLETPWMMIVENAVFNAFCNRQDPNPTATLNMLSPDFKLMMTGHVKAIDLMSDNKLTLDGDVEKLAEFSELIDKFNQNFPIVTPRNI
jgi:alkyl sulfatase BDS1-like metallo-beta-lactamase superfamily hydrolase